MARPPSFRFRSGEFVMLGMHIGEKPLMLAYSIASAAYADEVEFLSIKARWSPTRCCRVGAGFWFPRAPGLRRP